MSYTEELAVARSYRVREGGSYRGACPFCGGRNTYGIALRGGVLKWGCFRASCDVGGIHSGDLGEAGIRAKLDGQPLSAAILAPIPSILTPIENRPAILKYLEKYNALTSYDLGFVNIKYSPQEDRIMFPVGLSKEGYTGRGREGVKPKWKKYGDCSSLLTCGVGETAVVVEDSLSACAVGAIPEYTGCALLGTILTQQHVIELRDFASVIVCLDPDAMQKGLTMASRLGGSMRVIPNDLKYYNQDQIRRIMNDED